jgi:hypothetical protein
MIKVLMNMWSPAKPWAWACWVSGIVLAASAATKKSGRMEETPEANKGWPVSVLRRKSAGLLAGSVDDAVPAERWAAVASLTGC